mgnify:CR=1 FL=1|jgi:hypothetical protein
MKRAIETKDQINGVKTDEMMTILPHMYEVTQEQLGESSAERLFQIIVGKAHNQERV